MCQSGVSLLRLKYILIMYHHSAGYQQGYWDSLFVLEGNGSWGNEDMVQEAINYFSIIFKFLCWQLLKNKSFFSFFPPLFCKAADGLWQNLNSVNTTLPKFRTCLPQHKALILSYMRYRASGNWGLSRASGSQPRLPAPAGETPQHPQCPFTTSQSDICRGSFLLLLPL